MKYRVCLPILHKQHNRSTMPRQTLFHVSMILFHVTRLAVSIGVSNTVVGPLYLLSFVTIAPRQLWLARYLRNRYLQRVG